MYTDGKENKFADETIRRTTETTMCRHDHIMRTPITAEDSGTYVVECVTQADSERVKLRKLGRRLLIPQTTNFTMLHSFSDFFLQVSWMNCSQIH